MREIETQIEDSDFLKIQKTGKSIYQFSQEAIRKKLENEENQANKKMIEDSLLKTIDVLVKQEKERDEITKQIEDMYSKSLEVNLSGRQNTINNLAKLSNKFSERLEKFLKRGETK